MSFYLGKDNVGNSILHVTKEYTSELAIKGGESLNTTFHSGGMLSSAIIIPVTLQKRYMYWEFRYYYLMSDSNYYFINGIYKGNGNGENGSYSNFNYTAEIPITSVYTYTIPSTYAATYRSHIMAGDNNILYLDSNYKPVANATAARLVGSSQGGSSFETYLTPGLVGFMELHFESAPELGSIKYIVILKPNYYPALVGSCTVNSNGIYIGNTDVFAGKTLLTNSPIADMPIFNNLGIINTTTSNLPGIQISSSNATTTIAKGGKTIFDSRYSYYRSINPKSSFTITTPGGVRDSLVYVCDLDGDYVSIDTSTSVIGWGYLTTGSNSGLPKAYPIPAGTYSCTTNTMILVNIVKMSTSKGLIAGFHLYYLQIQDNKLYYYCRTLARSTIGYGTMTLKIKIY